MPTSPLSLYTRRRFLRNFAGGAGLVALSAHAPRFLLSAAEAGQPRPERDRRVLVLVQLAGGNDGLNTVIPYSNDEYATLRPNLRIPAQDVLRLDDHHGLHPACAALRALHDQGRLGIVHNVGYPNPNRSHFRSMEIWETGESAEIESTGWLGRYFDHQCSGAPEDPCGVHFSAEQPPSFVGAHSHSTFGQAPGRLGRAGRRRELELMQQIANVSLGDDETAGTFLQKSLLDTLVTERRVAKVLEDYRPSAVYPGGAFAQSLRGVASLIAGGFGTRVYFVSLGGFDTHANQARTHADLLRTLSEGLAAFQDDLEKKGLADQVLTMTFSEFGRRPAENRSGGTDHGTAAPLFVLGSRVRPGFHGTPAELKIQRGQDLAFSTDFRSVYAGILDGWLGADSKSVLGHAFPPVPVVA